jgi:leucyl/phenylalanyl-tRNA--protein transferase
MPFRKRQVGWWSPDPRGIMPRNGMVVSRSLRQSARRFRVSADTAFTDVMRRCGDPRRPHGWINEHFITAYSRLHQMGYAHSVEVWLDDELVGGVYGVRISRFFAGESMFHTATDASKVALWALVQALHQADVELFDVQWSTPHLASLGVVDVPRTDYLHRLAAATAR